MRKISTYAFVLALIVAAFAACAKVGPPVAGSAKAEDMLTLLPKATTGVIVIDINRALNTDFVTKTLKEGEHAAKYQEFIKKTGIDPQKDVFFLAIGLAGGMETHSGVGIVNMKYAKDALLAKLKESEAKFTEGVYEGVATIAMHEGEMGEEKAEPAEKKEAGEKAEAEKKEAAEKPEPPEVPGKVMLAAFLDASNIAVGPEKEVQAVIDVLKKKGENALANPELKALIKGADKTAIAWGVISFKAEDVKKMVESTPMLSSLAPLKALSMAFDYRDKVMEAELKAVTSDSAKNKEIADMLNGFKAMGALVAGGKPEVGEVLNKIEITSAPDFVKIHAALPEELLQRLGKMAETEIKNKMGGGKVEEPAKGEEKKEEKKPVEKKK